MPASYKYAPNFASHDSTIEVHKRIASSLFHHRGGKKAENGKETSFEDIANMPMNIGTMDVYVHSGAIVFTDYKNKFVLQPNQKVKINREKTIVTNHLSSSRVKDKNAFDVEHGYMKIK